MTFIGYVGCTPKIQCLHHSSWKFLVSLPFLMVLGLEANLGGLADSSLQGSSHEIRPI
jgi:hypothetical protein